MVRLSIQALNLLLLMIKKYHSAGGSWVILDNKRDPDNVVSHRLFPNLANAESTSRNYDRFFIKWF